MIDMFTNYQNLSESYIPNNLSSNHTEVQSYTKLNPIKTDKPYELYDAKGNLEGYYWYEGDTITLEFNLDGEILLDNGDKIQYQELTNYLKDKYLKLAIYNFRLNEIYSDIKHAEQTSIFGIDKELSKKLIKGIYYCSLEIFNNSMHETIFSSNDCKFLVK